MYFDQRVVMKSPLIIKPLKDFHDRLAVVVGDSSLITNIALMYVQHVTYTTDESILEFASIFANMVPREMMFHYQSIIGETTIAARAALKNDIYIFIIQAAQFFRNDYTLNPILKQAAQQNCYLCVDRVMDDASPPYIEGSIKRRT